MTFEICYIRPCVTVTGRVEVGSAGSAGGFVYFDNLISTIPDKWDRMDYIGNTLFSAN